MEIKQIIVQLIAAYVATVTAGINVQAPKKFLLWAGVPGVISYAVYLLVLPLTHYFIATFLGSLVVSVLGQIMARRFRTVVNVFYIPAFFLFVPGTALYETAYQFINNDLMAASAAFYRSIATALSIGLAVFVVDSAMETYKYHKEKQNGLTVHH